MIQSPIPQRVVRSWPGRGTGETFYETETGEVWRGDACRTNTTHFNSTCSPRRAILQNGMVIE